MPKHHRNIEKHHGRTVVAGTHLPVSPIVTGHRAGHSISETVAISPG